MIDDLFDRNVIWSSLFDAEKRGQVEGYAGLPEPITMLRRHAVEAFTGPSMIEPQVLEEGRVDAG